MNLSTIESALAYWVRTGSGLDNEHVFWAFQDRPRPSGNFIEMRLSEIRRIGHDWVDAENNPLVIADDVVESVSAAANTLTLTAHGLLTGDGPIRFTTTGTLPGGIEVDTNYWVIKIDADTIKLAETYPDSINTVILDITGVGTGTHTLHDTDDTLRTGSEIAHIVRGQRQAILSLQCFAGMGQGQSATVPVQLLENVLSAYLIPSIKDVLVAAKIGFGPPPNIKAVDGAMGFSVFEPRAMVEIRLFLASETAGATTEAGPIIQYVEVERVDEDGNTVSSDFIPEDPH